MRKDLVEICVFDRTILSTDVFTPLPSSDGVLVNWRNKNPGTVKAALWKLSFVAKEGGPKYNGQVETGLNRVTCG